MSYKDETLSHYGVKTASADMKAVVTYQKGREIKIYLRAEEMTMTSGTVDEVCQGLKVDQNFIKKDLNRVVWGMQKWIGDLWSRHGWTDKPHHGRPVFGEPKVGDKYGDLIMWGDAYYTYHPGKDFDWSTFKDNFKKTAKGLGVYDVKFK